MIQVGLPVSRENRGVGERSMSHWQNIGQNVGAELAEQSPVGKIGVTTANRGQR